MSTSYSSSLGRSFGGGYKSETGPDHIIPGGEFDGLSSSPAHRSGSQEQPNQPVFGNSSFRVARYEVSATRSHQPSDSMDSKQGANNEAPPATYPGMAITMDDRPGSYHPPESHSRMMPSTPVPIPNRGQQHSHTWDARYPPPLSSTSTAAYTNAMTPSTGRHMSSFPTMGFHIKNSFESPPSWHFEATPPSQQHQQQQYHSQPQMLVATPQHVYATPTPVSRRPALLTTPSSAPMAGRFNYLPARRLPGSTSQPHFVLPAPMNMLNNSHDLPPSSPPGEDGASRRPWPSVQNDIFLSRYETHFDQNGRPMLKRSPSSRPSKEHRCPTCRKVFARPSALQTHQAVHTGAKRESAPATPVILASRHANNRPDRGRHCSLPVPHPRMRQEVLSIVQYATPRQGMFLDMTTRTAWNGSKD